MTKTAYPLRIPEEIVVLSRMRAKEEHVDQSTALRQFLHTGVEEYVLGLLAEGRISIGKAAELLKTTVYDIHFLARKHRVEIGATPEQAMKSRITAKKLFRS